MRLYTRKRIISWSDLHSSSLLWTRQFPGHLLITKGNIKKTMHEGPKYYSKSSRYIKENKSSQQFTMKTKQGKDDKQWQYKGNKSKISPFLHQVSTKWSISPQLLSHPWHVAQCIPTFVEVCQWVERTIQTESIASHTDIPVFYYGKFSTECAEHGHRLLLTVGLYPLKVLLLNTW